MRLLSVLLAYLRFKAAGSALYEDTKIRRFVSRNTPSAQGSTFMRKLDMLSVQQQAGLRSTSVPRVLLNLYCTNSQPITTIVYCKKVWSRYGCNNIEWINHSQESSPVRRIK